MPCKVILVYHDGVKMMRRMKMMVLMMRMVMASALLGDPS